MILSEMRLTQTLIRLQGRAGWSEPLLLANPEDKFSRVEAHIFENYGTRLRDDLDLYGFQISLSLYVF